MSLPRRPARPESVDFVAEVVTLLLTAAAEHAHAGRHTLARRHLAKVKQLLR